MQHMGLIYEQTYFVVLVATNKIWCLSDYVTFVTPDASTKAHTGLILSLRPANEKLCYFVTRSLIGWALA